MTRTTNSEAWEAFYKSGKIGDYISFKSANNNPASDHTASLRGDDTTDATDVERPGSAPATG